MLRSAALTAQSLAAVLEQSSDCVKLIGQDGTLMWMNPNGMCLMEIDRFELVRGQPWHAMWPEAWQNRIRQSLADADSGGTVRFTAPCPTARGRPRWWEVSVTRVTDHESQPLGYLSISRDITQVENDREALRVLLAEMRHRLKNSYTIVGSLLRGVARGNPSLEQFAAEVDQRINALAAAQSLFSAHDFDQDSDITTLRPLLETVVAPFSGHPLDAVAVDAPDDLVINRRSADAIALVVGELAVNSAKHGAIAHGGSIAVDGALVEGQLLIRWTERCHRAVEATSRDGGQGLALIHRIVKARAGTLAIDWQADGLVASLMLPG